ncbi:MAG: tetratricopeptide repeat protein [Vampirovibrionia bacterium]
MSSNDIDKLEELVKSLPENAKLRLALGKSYLSVGNVEEARRELETAITLNPTDPECFLKLGNVVAEDQDFEMAIVYYQKALALDPFYVEALYCLGMAYVDTRQNDDVEKVIRRLEQLHPLWAQGLKSYYSKIL